MPLRLTEYRQMITIPSDGTDLGFVRTDRKRNDTYQCWEAVRPTSATSDHRYMVETYDGGETWGGQMQARGRHRSSVVRTDPKMTYRSMSDVVRALRNLYAARR